MASGWRPVRAGRFVSLTLLHGDSFHLLGFGPEVGVVCCDPPYGLEFMGKDWDRLDIKGSATRPNSSETAADRSTRGMRHGIHAGKPAFDLTAESQQAMQEWHVGWLSLAFERLSRGGWVIAFSGTRTYHRLAAAMVQVGLVDVALLGWGYGSGFPKSLNVAISLDKQAGVIGHRGGEFNTAGRVHRDLPNPTRIGRHKPITPEAQEWDGWGTALKPAWEPAVYGRKP